MTLFNSSDFALSLSIEISARPHNLSSAMVVLKYVLMSFNFEKDLSAVAVVTGIERKRKIP